MSQQLEAVVVVFGTVFALVAIVSLAVFAYAIRLEWTDRREKRRVRIDEPLTSRPRIGMSRRYSA